MILNAIIPCGGIGKRTGLSYNKIFYRIDGEEMILKTVRPFLSIDSIKSIIIVYNASDLQHMKELFDGESRIRLVEGGATRSESVIHGLNAVDEDAEYVLIHDGARPFVSEKLIKDCINAAEEYGAAVPFLPVTDTIKHIKDGETESTPPRNEYVTVQTPQVFNLEKIRYAYDHTDGEFTDDTQIYEKFFGSVKLVEGEKTNIKITSKDDLNQRFNVGIGYDTHRLAEGRKLILGGIEIPHNKGLVGHSDADVLTHAIMDSILTACNERDIGVLFPDTDNKYKDIYSIKLLEEVYSTITAKGYRINNISAVIMAEKPKLRDYIPLMKKKLAETLHTEIKDIGISATTTEGIGFVGREEGIASQSICSVIKTEA